MNSSRLSDKFRASVLVHKHTNRRGIMCCLLQMKQISVRLAKVYMRKVSLELESTRRAERESAQEALLFEGVRFAYRAHQASHSTSNSIPHVHDNSNLKVNRLIMAFTVPCVARQFAGGLDSETMLIFEELKRRVEPQQGRGH